MNDKSKANIAVKIRAAACLAIAVMTLFFLFSGAEGAPVNINDASFEKLLDLDGIDEESAAKIIKYRRENNGFKTIYDLLKVDGITGEIFEKIKDGINVGSAQDGGAKPPRPPAGQPPKPPAGRISDDGGAPGADEDAQLTRPAGNSVSDRIDEEPSEAGGVPAAPQAGETATAPRETAQARPETAVDAEGPQARETEHSFEEGRKTTAARKTPAASGSRGARIGGDIKRIELTPENYYKVIIGLMRLAKYDKAENNIADFARKFPSDKRADDMNYLMGSCLEEAEKYKEAIELYEKVYQNQNSELRGIALFRIGVCNDLMGDAAQALDSYRKYVSSFSSSSCVKEAENRIEEMLKTK